MALSTPHTNPQKTFWLILFFTLSSLTTTLCTAATTLNTEKENKERRIALVIGNSNYENIDRLKNPERDVRLIHAALERLNFDVEILVNASHKTMSRALRRHSERLIESGRNTVGFIFFAGHGLQVRQNNYLLPVDAEINKESDASLEAIHLASVLNLLFSAENKLNVIILDACRDNPYRTKLRAASTGLSGFEAPVGTLVSFSTGPNKVAYDGVG